ERRALVDRQRQDESGLARRKAADDDDRHYAGADSDMPMPRRQPIITLERRAYRRLLEAPPLVFGGGKTGVDAKADLRRDARGCVGLKWVSRARGFERDGVHPRACISERRQWCRTRHCMYRRNFSAMSLACPCRNGPHLAGTCAKVIPPS